MRQIDKGLLAALLITTAASLVYAQQPADTAVAGQQRINLAQASGDAGLAEYDRLLKENTGLVVYNGLLERQIQTQAQELQELRAAIGQVPELERQIPPLLIRMVEGLEQFVALDIPFLQDERIDSLAKLQLMLENANISNAEKFRRVLEAWQIENEYGRGYSAYIGQLEIDGAMREVDFLRVGRIALLYQTADDEASTGVWNSNDRAWVPLGSQHRNSVRQAVQMARSQVAPNLVLLPMLPAQ